MFPDNIGTKIVIYQAHKMVNDPSCILFHGTSYYPQGNSTKQAAIKQTAISSLSSQHLLHF